MTDPTAGTPRTEVHCVGCQGWHEPEYLRRETCPGIEASGTGLDVERLARAMDPMAFEDLSHVRSTTTLTEGEWQALVVEVHLRRGRVMRRAADFAAEYARLSPVPVPPEEDR